MNSYAYRRIKNNIMLGGAVSCAMLSIGILFLIFLYVLFKGVAYINLEFFTNTPKPVGEEGGGILPSILGTIVMVGASSLLAIPIGLGAGIFVSEYASPRTGDLVRATADVMTGVPSIVVGLFVYLVVVVRAGHFSGYAGALALAIIMLPIMARASEEMLKLVPNSHREAALALGLPQWRSILSIVLPAASRGLLTGGLLAIARAAGETAPLIFTSLGSRFTTYNLDDEMDALPLRVYRYSIGPYPDWHEQAWAASLVLVLMVLLFMILARAIVGTQNQGR